LNVVAWRIVKRKWVWAAFRGEGARRYGGRWNSKGVAVIYLAESQSLAALELLAHLESSQLLMHYRAIPVEFDARLILHVELRSLPKNWQAYPAPPELKAIGDGWVASGEFAVLQVPSVMVPAESNFLLNPHHADFRKLRIGKSVRFQFDPRLMPLR
jgi:RES domain-containing protein